MNKRFMSEWEKCSKSVEDGTRAASVVLDVVNLTLRLRYSEEDSAGVEAFIITDGARYRRW